MKASTLLAGQLGCLLIFSINAAGLMPAGTFPGWEGELPAIGYGTGKVRDLCQVHALRLLSLPAAETTGARMHPARAYLFRRRLGESRKVCLVEHM